MVSIFSYLEFDSESGASMNWMQNSFKLLCLTYTDVQTGLWEVFTFISFLNL